VIGGTSEENDALIAAWPHGKFIGAPVWHMNEPDERFIRLCHEFPRVCIGSMGEYDAKLMNACLPFQAFNAQVSGVIGPP
ncbi:hypothetical protein ACT4US_20405, partial [Bacillus sp. HC-Mk]